MVGGKCFNSMISFVCKYVILQHHAIQYQTLSHMACDYLAIQGLAVPSEHAFASSGITAVAHCNQLTGDIFEALQILKSGYQNGHIWASEQAGTSRNSLG